MAALPHITVLMSTRNGAAHLRPQLASLAAQDHPGWSLWIGDDGSSDATRSLLRAFAEDRPNPVILWPGPGRGTSANVLGLLCHPDLPPGPVAFADQDDLWLPDHLSRGLAAMAADPAPSAGQAYVARRIAWRADGLRQISWPTARAPGFDNALVENLLTGNALMLDAAAVACARRAGGVDVPFWDWWLYLLLTGAGARILRDARPGVMYRAHGQNQVGPRQGPRAALWRLGQVMTGQYGACIDANLAALEPHMDLLTPASRATLIPLLAQSARPRLRALSPHRQRPQDRAALWLAGTIGQSSSPSRYAP